MVHQTNKKTEQPRKKMAIQNRMSAFEDFDQTTYFFHKYGSCFNQLQVNNNYRITSVFLGQLVNGKKLKIIIWI